MKSLIAIAVGLLSAVTAATAAAAATFEGVVEYTVTSGKRSLPLRYTIKGDQVLMEMNAETKDAFAAFYDVKTGQVKMLMHEQKMYMVVGGLDEAMEDVDIDASIEKTDRTETIAGYPCTLYIITERRGDTHEVWATTGLGRYVSVADVQRNRGKDAGWSRLLAEEQGFPLRVVTKNRRGRVVSTMEATRVEKKSIDSSVFEVPAGYTEFKMPGVGDALRGLMGR